MLGNQVDGSVFTLGDESDDESLRQQPEATTISAAHVRANESNEHYRGDSAGAALENGLSPVSPGEPGNGMETFKQNGAEKQRTAHTSSPYEPRVAEEYRGLNGKSQAAPPETKEGVSQLDGQAGAAPSSQQPMAQSPAITVETTNGDDKQKGASPPIVEQPGKDAAVSLEGPGAPERDSQSDSQTSAVVNQERAEPATDPQAVSTEAEEQRIAEVRFRL